MFIYDYAANTYTDISSLVLSSKNNFDTIAEHIEKRELSLDDRNNDNKLWQFGNTSKQLFLVQWKIKYLHNVDHMQVNILYQLIREIGINQSLKTTEYLFINSRS